MSEIDWSKAPEGATHYFPSTEEWYLAGNGCAPLVWTGMWCKAFQFSQREHKCVQRPTTPSWSGEGLPPVGVVCRIIADDSAWWKYSGLTDGEDVTVCHSFKNSKGYDMVVVEACNGACLAVTVECVAPIRTPEQIAADEREAALGGMIDVAAKAIGISFVDVREMELLHALYDAGYRKP